MAGACTHGHFGIQLAGSRKIKAVATGSATTPDLLSRAATATTPDLLSHAATATPDLLSHSATATATAASLLLLRSPPFAARLAPTRRPRTVGVNLIIYGKRNATRRFNGITYTHFVGGPALLAFLTFMIFPRLSQVLRARRTIATHLYLEAANFVLCDATSSDSPFTSHF